MSITKSIGKNTLGGGGKMNIDLRTYNRSTHDLSYAWRSTMGIGTLVPFMCEVGLPGDTWNIQLSKKVLTIPTIGPLFGSFKLQMDVFTCPIRLYNAMLHNNMLNIGLKMSDVKLPAVLLEIKDQDLPTADNENPQVSQSSLLAYLGHRGFSGKTGGVVRNITPVIAYYDIFKNYYANKQEDKFYYIGSNGREKPLRNSQVLVGGYCVSGSVTFRVTNNTNNLIIVNSTGEKQTIDYVRQYYDMAPQSGTQTVDFTRKTSDTTLYKGYIQYIIDEDGVSLISENLNGLDTIREQILSTGKNAYNVTGGKLNSSATNILEKLFARDESGYLCTNRDGYGLVLKTHQSDIFNNWINTEWLENDNGTGINQITAVDTSTGSFTIDTLNLSQKVYDMLNRIAVSGGTYKDWIETVYTNNWTVHTETPVYEGGASSEIIFQEVVSTNTSDKEALGTLAGRGKDTNEKGGNLKIKINEPCYIIGLVSITPRIDYCQGNRWDTRLDTLDDLHKPALDGIGFQDLMAWKMAWWADDSLAIGKQPAWLDYMTNYNRTFGGFAREDDSAFMVLNRYYYPENGNYKTGKINYTTYINPEDFNYTFANTVPNAENFWVQIGVGAEVRRVMSAKQIPNL